MTIRDLPGSWPEKNASLFFALLALCALFSCSDSRIYDLDHDLQNGQWAVDSTQLFSVEVKDTSAAYNIFYKIRNAADYEFYNLYMKYTLQDSVHQPMKSGLQEVILFDPKTGTPYGKGLGDIFSHEFPMLTNFSFAKPGTYYFKIQQYMRVEELAGVHSVGLRIDKATIER